MCFLHFQYGHEGLHDMNVEAWPQSKVSRASKSVLSKAPNIMRAETKKGVILGAHSVSGGRRGSDVYWSFLLMKRKKG